MSVTWTTNAHDVTFDNEALRKVVIWSDADRPASTTDYYGVRVGIGRGENVDWLGTYDGSADVLVARTSRDLSGSTAADRLLTAGDTLLVEVTRTGTPLDDATGLTVEWHMNLVGGESTRTGALFTPAGMITDPRMRAAVDGLTAQLNRSGVQSWTIPVYLADPNTEPGLEADDLFEDDDQTITAGGSLEDGDVSLTFTLPEGKTTGYVFVEGKADVNAVGAAGEGFVAMGDGTTDHNEMAIDTSTTLTWQVASFFAGTISDTTTFTLRFRATTNNMVIGRQAIAGVCAWQ